MSNYKPRIESNNLDLTSILSTINELPDAGPSVETCTVTLGDGAGDYIYLTAVENDVLIPKIFSGYDEVPYGTSITIPKNSIMFVGIFASASSPFDFYNSTEITFLRDFWFEDSLGGGILGTATLYGYLIVVHADIYLGY